MRQPMKKTTFKGVMIKSLIKAMIKRTSSFTGWAKLGKLSSCLISCLADTKKTPEFYGRSKVSIKNA